MFRSSLVFRGFASIPRMSATRLLSSISRPTFSNTIAFTTTRNSLLASTNIFNNSFPSISPFKAQMEIVEPSAAESEDNTVYMDSVLRKRRLKMKKHKLRKRRREQRSLKKRLGKL
ncbi:hypothetical protein G9P44_002357 [Scheffersomyces stipitis]|nr:hypothetical protein G9P44_002357 [Scheffersomyces stipitis]